MKLQDDRSASDSNQEEPVEDEINETLPPEGVDHSNGDGETSQSEAEDDFSDPELEGVGCVKVVNDVEFDFDEDGMVFIPPPPNVTFDAQPKRSPGLGANAPANVDNR